LTQNTSPGTITIVVIIIVICQTIAFNEEKKKILRRELEINIAAADCPYIVKFFGAFFVEVGISQLSPDLPKTVHCFRKKST